MGGRDLILDRTNEWYTAALSHPDTEPCSEAGVVGAADVGQGSEGPSRTGVTRESNRGSHGWLVQAGLA